MSARQQNRDEILYIYDRVCTREAKQREVFREYGLLDAATDNPSREAVYESPYVRRAEVRAQRQSGPAPSRRHRGSCRA